MNITKPVTNVTVLWDSILLIVRIWFGYVMMHNGKLFFDLITSEDNRQYFEVWFGKMHFPFPLFMAFLAKGSEFFGGLLVLIGLFTRVGASFVAFTMFMATVAANLGKNWGVDGTITVSFCLFAVIFVYWGAGKYSLDAIFFKKAAT